MQQYVFYGAVDLNTSIIERAMEHVEHLNGELVCFIDDNPEKQGDENYPRKVCGKNVLKQYPQAIIVILSSAVEEISTALKKEGYENKIMAYPLFRWWFPCVDIQDVNSYIEKWSLENEKDIIKYYNQEDFLTNKILTRLLKQRLMRKFDFVDAQEMYGFHYKDYFYDELLRPDENELTIVDCGAYQGDSLFGVYQIFGDRIKKAYAFEPDAKNMLELKKFFAAKNMDKGVTFVEAGVSNENKVYRFNSKGMNGQLDESGDEEIQVCMLDNQVNNVQGKLCLMLDVEGYEVAALEGAKQLISEHKPYIIACLYHKPTDILEVPAIIKSICPEYDFYLRAGTHTECYAIPKK